MIEGLENITVYGYGIKKESAEILTPGGFIKLTRAEDVETLRDWINMAEQYWKNETLEQWKDKSRAAYVCAYIQYMLKCDY